MISKILLIAMLCCTITACNPRSAHGALKSVKTVTNKYKRGMSFQGGHIRVKRRGRGGIVKFEYDL